MYCSITVPVPQCLPVSALEICRHSSLITTGSATAVAPAVRHPGWGRRAGPPPAGHSVDSDSDSPESRSS